MIFYCLFELDFQFKSTLSIGAVFFPFLLPIPNFYYYYYYYYLLLLYYDVEEDALFYFSVFY